MTVSNPAFVALEFPSWIRWGQRCGAILVQPKGLGANGRRLCRWCASEVPKGSQSWCSHRCVDQFKRVWSWGAMAEYVIERDVACRRCTCEHPGWNRSRSLLRVEYVASRHAWTERRETLIERGYRREHHVLSPWWEVDHITPVKDGGTDDPENLRLLCHACHVVAGIEQRRARKAQSTPELELA